MSVNKIRLGVLGADDSLDVIEEVAKEFGEICITPVVYWEEGEIEERMRPLASEVDMWLCSGQVPYSIAKELYPDCPVFYTRHSGEGLYKVLLHLAHEHGLRISDLSFDTLSPDSMRRVLDDIGIQCEFYLKHYTGVIHSDELVQYHQSLWEQGRTKTAITCLRSAQLKLEQLGIPAKHITPTSSEVRQVLEAIVKTHDLMVSRNAQVVVQLVQRTPFATFMTEKDLDAAMSRYARFLHGTKQQVATDQWAVYATRGATEEITNHFRSRPRFELIANVATEAIYGGIGIGSTVSEAINRARLALSQAQVYGHGSWACALETNTLIAPLEEGGRSLALEYAREDLQKLSGAVPLSALTLSKIAGIVTKRKSTRITVNELAEYLNILPRSARRILLQLEDNGLATVVGEETAYQRGRPRKIYDIQNLAPRK
ncbi:ArsR family transcriptional regulator [Alicyclobacillus fastidiosus]|uniref:ArsR family transcriptional regulator n=1 Tax=Alicyclobacillus fastidiosus TaxID=392011 RepID=A0ABY6ZM01_9BACL|nr:ArsR family transcriptional regulator [Alicyclobacillus fastidiosus]WAH43948.1 ArsR family transcriptional regulator [Alicyclobacillus fastidiosus]